MANSKTLLVYVLALVVCGGSSSFWVSANTVPLLKEPVAVAGASPQHQKHQQQRVQQQQQILTAQHQQIQETSRTSPSSPSPSSATPVVRVAPPLHQFHGATNNNNNAPPTYSIKNAWGLSAGSSDSGPYTAGYGYISGRTLQQPVTSHKNDYQQARTMERPITSRQTNLFPGFSDALSSFFTGGVNLKGLVLGGIMQYGVQNFGLPETFNSLIPMRSFFNEWSTKAANVKEEKETLAKKKEPISLKEIKQTSPIEETNEIPMEDIPSMNVAPEKDAPIENKVPSEDTLIQKKIPAADAPVENKVSSEDTYIEKKIPTADAPSKTEISEKDVLSEKKVPVKDNEKEPESTNRRSRRDISPQPDTDLTELAAMVLSAIQSGECMQRSICILGTQIGASNKGRAAFTLVDKLVPESVQGNQYFVTLKKALRGGESFCDRFRCRLN